MLSIVLATVQLSHADTARELKKVIEGRIQAISNVAELFAESRWKGADLPHSGHARTFAILSGWRDVVSRRWAEPNVGAEGGSGNCYDFA
jgi:hypothetical protein